MLMLGGDVQFCPTTKSENPLLFDFVPGSLRVCVNVSMILPQLLVPMGVFSRQAPLIVCCVLKLLNRS